MFDFELIPGLDFEYDAREMAAIYEAVRQTVSKVSGREYVIENFLVGARIMALPVVNTALHAMPIEGFFDVGFYQEAIIYLRMIINQWQQLKVEPRSNLDQIFKRAFPTLAPRVVELLINILRVAEYNLEKVNLLTDIYNQFSQQLNPIYEMTTLMSSGQDVQVLYPYIDQSNLFHLIEMNIKSVPGEISVEVVTHNYQGQVFSKELHSRLSQGLETSFKKFSPSIKFKYATKGSEIFTGQNITNVPIDTRTVFFMHFVRYMLLNPDETYKKPSLSPTTKGLNEREIDLQFLDRHQQLSSHRARLSLHEKSVYARYFINTSAASIFGLLNALFEMAEFSVGLGAFSRAKHIYSRITFLIRQYSFNSPTKEFLTADAKSAAEKAMLELKRRASDNDVRDINLETKLMPVSKNALLATSYEQRLDGLNRKMQSCLLGVPDKLAKIILQLRNVVNVSSDEKFREVISNLILKIRRPESFCNLDLLLIQKPTERSNTGPKLPFAFVGANSTKKIITEIKTLPDLLRDIQTVKKTVSDPEEVTQDEKSKEALALLDSLYGYYHNFLKEFETADVSTRTTMASQNISVVLPGGVTDFIEANDNRLFQIDDTGNLVKRAGPGQSAIFYFNGLFSKGINTSAPSGPGFQIAHDKLFRKLFNAQTAVTQVMLLSHPKGFSYLLQLSEEIKGTLLQDWLANGNDLKKLDFESFAVCAFMSMTTQPGDAKPDNFIVVEKEGKNKVVYFDTDIYGKGSIEKVKDGMHFSMIKSVMYCMPQMSQKVPESLRHRLITLCPETLILDWLEEILLQNEKYGQMLSYFPPESVVSLKNKLIVKYDLNFIFAFYYSLVGLIDELKLNPEITLQQLFQKVDPVTYEIYQNANSIFNTGQTGTDIVNRIRYIYGNHRDFARKSVEETIPPHHRFVNGATLEEVLQKELGVVDRAGSKELLLPERLIEGFVNSINFSLCDLENIGAIFERLTSFAPRFKSLTLRHIELVSVEKVVMVLKAAVQLKELNIVGRHSLSSGDIQRVLSDNPELNLALTLTSPGAIQVYRSMAASHRGKFSFLTVTESRVLQPSFYQYHWINYPLQYLLENLGLPSAASYVLQNSENDINALHSKRGQGIAHALVHRMNEYLGLNEVFGSNSTPGIKDSDDTVNRLLTLTQDSKNSSSKTQDLSSEESGVQVIKLYQHYIFSWFITLKIYGVDINLLNTSGQAPIHMTAEFGIPNLMTFLLEEMNANVRLQTAGLNENIFHIAVRKKHIELLKILFEKLDTETIATLTSEQFNLNGEAPVHAAVRDYAIFAVFLKYEKKGVNFGVLSFSKLIPLHYVLMEKIVPGTFDESQKSAIVKQLLLLGHDGTGKELSELPADTAKRCAPELVEEINGHYERKHDDFDKRTHRPNLQTMELNQDDSLKKQYEYLFARAEEFRVQSEDSLKDISFRMERAIQAISCLVSGMKIAEQVLSYNNKIPVCEDKIDKIIKKFVSIYGDFQAVSFSNSCKFFQEARKEMIRIWLASYNMQGSNNGRTVAEESSRKLKQLLAKSIDANMTLLGKPPVNYAIYILGPLVRERVDIFSNVALGFVFEEKPNTKSMEYFQCLSFLLRTNFLRTGEAGDIFVQLSNGDQQGIAFSNQKFGMRMESNELFPSGKTSFSLPMGSPKDVAGYMQSPELWRIWSDFNTASLLRVDDRSFGTEALIEQLKKKFSESLSWSAVALDYIHAIIEEFRQEIFTQTNIKGVLDLNHIYFRFPFLLVEQLCVFFKVSERGFFDNLQSLMAEGYLSKEMVSSLTEVLSRWIVFSTRVKNFYQEDKTIVVLNPESILEKNMFSKTGLYECNAGDISDIKEFLSISYVLYRAAITFVTNKPKVFYVLNPSAPKLKNPAMVFSEMIVSKYERSVSIEEKADPEIFVLYGIEYLMAEKYRELENVVRMLTDMMAQQSFPKELKKEALYLQVSYLRGAKHYHASIKILDTLINHIKSELSGESLNKLYEGNADKKSDRKSIGPETASLSRVSNISLAFPLHLLAHSLLHVDLFQSAMNAVVETLKINKKKALSVLGQAKALLLAIKILNQMGRSNESQPYFNELLGLMPKIERKYFGLFGEIARSNASFVIEQPSFSDNLRMELTQQLMLKASYHDLCLFGDNTQSALSNAVIFYKLADLLSQRSVSAK
ncbi:MAG: ankyrin repeat domain-containing protein, partial [Proteobacteria bacterium]|nr:ankyrin repeat domain-containing protein [Pseudomonadota bacterium]